MTHASVRQALSAIEHGSLSMEEALRKAVASTPREFGQWLRQTLPQRTAGRRRVQVWRVRDYPEAIAAAAVKAVRQKVGKRRTVISVHWGIRRERGRPCAENCVVIHCAYKAPTSALRKRQRFPSSVRVKVRGRTHIVPVDVQGVGWSGLPQAIASAQPAANRRVWMDAVAGEPVGTLGALVRDSTGATRAVLSGHVALKKGRGVFVETTPNQGVAIGKVDAVVRDADSDVAWTTAIANASDVLTRAPASIRNPTNADLRTAVTVLVSTDFRGRTSFLDDLGVQAPISFSDGVIEMRGLAALSPQVTVPGDSGAPVLDHNGTLIGLVVGAIGNKTLIVPARSACNDLEP
jgi:hypothetical protein